MNRVGALGAAIPLAACLVAVLLSARTAAGRQEQRATANGIQVEAYGPDGKVPDPWGWKSGTMSMQIVPGTGEYLYIRDVDYGQAHDVIVRKVLAVIHKPDLIKLRVSAEMSANVATTSPVAPIH